MNIQMSKSLVVAGNLDGDLRTHADKRAAPVQALSQALKVEDLDAARQAYAGIVRNALPGATLEAGSPFAQLGKALAAGDLAAAQEAFDAGMKAHRRGTDSPAAPAAPDLPLPVPVAPSSTGGVAGGTVNVTA